MNSEQEGFAVAKRLLSFLPSNSRQAPPRYAENDPADRKTPEIRDLIPVDPQKSFDMKSVIRSFVDNGDFFEVQENFAQNMVVGFARMAGETVGIVAISRAYWQAA